MLREVVDFRVISEEKVFQISRIRGNLKPECRTNLEIKINNKFTKKLEGDVSNIDLQLVIERAFGRIGKDFQEIIDVSKCSSTIKRKKLTGLAAIVETCDDYYVRGGSKFREPLLKAVQIVQIEATSYPLDVLTDGDYKIAILSPTETAKFSDIGLFLWIGNSYEWIQYKSKMIFAFTVEDFTKSEENPICLGNNPKSPSKSYWLYNEKVYWENDYLDEDSIKALADARESKKQRKVEFLKGPEKKQKSRRYIDDDVKVAVWRRDNARCVKCGSNKDLEFDHIIPVSMGGSSTERNLQLLCERCNREKGADLK